ALKEARPGQLDVGREADRPAFVHFGSSVVSGEATAIVVATGRRTVYGLIARRLEEQPPETDFQRGVRRFGALVARLTLILVVGVFAVDVGLGRPLLESLLFAVALAVGLTPELLPAIVTVNLSRGARALAGRGVLVKHLPAIQNLGSMTVLCTDKTGTLTAGQLSLERAIRADGADAPEVLAAAWLNSHFEAGFANPLDQAILAHATPPTDLGDLTKLGELPFDFGRRCLSIAVGGADGRAQLISKGAPEAIVARSGGWRTADGVAPLDAPARARLEALVAQAASQGYRTVAVATRPLAWGDGAGPGPIGPRALDPSDEADLTFEGLLLFRDPPKPEIRRTVQDLHDLGIELKILTGDDELVARAVADQVGLPVRGVLSGTQLADLGFPALVARARRTTIFARLDPDQKLRVIRALQADGSVVGYLGDGINDAPSLHVADVGISVDNATDVARSAADLILLEPSLAAVVQGVREGRRTFANTLKYIRMGSSSNFGNMLSMAGAALFLPFLPMLPGQILVNNLIYDASQTAIPSDGIDPEAETRPASWDIGGIERFMLVFGPLSSLFDYLTFGLLLVLLGTAEPAFQTGWFVESLATQTLVILAIRTRRVPFWRSRPSGPLVLAAALAVAVACLLPLSPLGPILGFVPLPLAYWLALPMVVVAYLALVEVAKRWFWPRVDRRAQPRRPA
ncbi:MAG TPA: magnesium-translocating P-type ATPase, partial [Candidatus Limnocylindrales bacterium]|nr:magnesium-translocating P-type ATPase [Candidatus Limnocylindrales bacterium]